MKPETTLKPGAFYTIHQGYAYGTNYLFLGKSKSATCDELLSFISANTGDCLTLRPSDLDNFTKITEQGYFRDSDCICYDDREFGLVEVL